jgi:hypothetical protein
MRIAVIGLLAATAILAAHTCTKPAAVEGYRTKAFDDHAIIAYELLENREASGPGDSQTNRAVFSRIRE